jgi:hypothetical protein
MPCHAAVAYNELAALENTLAAFVPIVVIAARQTQMINESITAYSTAVGPSSDTKNRRNLVANDFITSPLSHRPQAPECNIG